jgi:hypothetical protein
MRTMGPPSPPPGQVAPSSGRWNGSTPPSKSSAPTRAAHGLAHATLCRSSYVSGYIADWVAETFAELAADQRAR